MSDPQTTTPAEDILVIRDTLADIGAVDSEQGFIVAAAEEALNRIEERLNGKS